MTELPPPLWYKSMTAGADAKTGRMILGFELGPDAWLSFELQPDTVTGLADAISRVKGPGG